MRVLRDLRSPFLVGWNTDGGRNGSGRCRTLEEVTAWREIRAGMFLIG